MYKPPENTNRVKSIKCKFENIENQNNNDKSHNKKNGARGDLNNVRRNGTKTEIIAVDVIKQNLSRQLSDPAKRNIKRTPAFRFDRNVDKNNLFQRNAQNNRSCYFEKAEKFTGALKNNCDSNRNFINRSENLDKVSELRDETHIKPVLIKSKSSHDFAYIRSKFDKKPEDLPIIKHNENQRTSDPQSTTIEKIASLYTEPVPKALRNKPDIHSCDTIKLSDVKPEPNQVGLTDTLKAALKRPLPKGPAPLKPPRTFEHTPVKHTQKNSSFVHCHKDKEEVKQAPKPKKHDPRYMLNKLELALRNNLIGTKRSQEASTTSGEDSDDSLLSKSKTKRELPSIPDTPTNSFNFNCLNGLTICKSTYETIKEPTSAFFINCKEEPVYAEPFGFIQDEEKTEKSKSLYYLSTPLLNDGKPGVKNMEENLTGVDDCEGLDHRYEMSQKQMSAENSSLSSFTSDLDSAASTPLEEHNVFEAPKIKQLIENFENKQVANVKPDAPLNMSSDSSHRIEDLKKSLHKTLESCFDGERKNVETEWEPKERKVSVDSIISKFQTYVKTMPKYKKPKVHKEDRLFYCCLIVGWDTEKPQIKFKFPPNVNVPERIEDLCYPESTSGPLDVSNNAQCYSLVITNDKGERTFGYCRRVIPEGSTRCIPLAYCILSKFRAPRFYKRILIELESRHGIPDKLRDELISGFYYNKFPRPGESIKINLTNIIDLNTHKRKVERQRPASIPEEDSLVLSSFVHINTSTGYGVLNVGNKTANYENITINDTDNDGKGCPSSPSVIVENNGTTELILTLHHDTRYEEADLKSLHELPSEILLKIFASLLLERKVILISCLMSKLSCCMDALQSILYPFSWPHTFIPILPQCLWDVVESPTPVICGVLSTSVVNEHTIENGIVVDVDEKNILSKEGDEDRILSGSMKAEWRKGICMANQVSPDEYAHSADYVHSVYLSDAYIKVFVASLKHYKNHIVNGSFEKDSFIRNGKTKGIRTFLKWFTETTMFTSFIDSVLTNPNSFTLFDKKIEMYGTDDSKMIRMKLMNWNKKPSDR